MFSIIIPVYPPHFNLLDRLIKNIDSSYSSKELVKEIIICASEIDSQQSNNLLSNLQNSTKIKIIINNTLEKQNASQNRNRGWNIVNSEYIIFLDADDIYHPNRIVILKEIIESNNYPDSLVHNYLLKKDIDISNPIFNEIKKPYKLIKSLDTYNRTFPNNFRDESKETGHYGDTNLICDIPLTQGSSVIKSKLNFRFNENMRWGEDGKILRDILYNNPENGVILIDEILIYY